MIILPSLEIVPAKYNGSTLLSQIPIDGTGDFAVTRATSPTTNQSTRVNALGQIELVDDNVPRLDYPIGGGCPALLVEPAATNGIRNNSMVGAVVGSPGTAPTNWAISSAGLTREIIATGSESGVQFIDIRFNGTATGTLAVIEHDSNTQIVASNGQIWTYSTYAKVVSAPTPPNAYQINIREFTSVGGTVSEGTSSYTPTSSLARYSATRTLSGGGTVARVAGRLYFTLTNGSTYDFTVRIGYPQMEQSSVATSVIPTTTQAITRAADVITDATASGVIGQTQGTIYAEVDVRTFANTGVLATISDGTASNLLTIYKFTDSKIYFDRTSATQSASTTAGSSATYTAPTILKIVIGYKSGETRMYINGVAATAEQTATFTFGTLTKVNIGSSRFDGTFFNDRIRAAALYPTRLTDTQLALLTSPYTSYSSMASALSYTLG